MTNHRPLPFLVLAAIVGTTVPGVAQAPAQAPAQAARIDAVVADALARYKDGLKSLDAIPVQAPIAAPSAGTRDLTLVDAVQLALDRNLDIAVERLNPQNIDLQVAGLRSVYQPVVSSIIGQRGVVQPPTSQLNGGTSVNNDTLTYNFGVAQPVPWGGGSFAASFNNSRLDTSNLFANYNPTYTSSVALNYTQPLLRGFKSDATRQQIAVTLINRDIADESLRGTVAATVANVRNAYWDLAYAHAAVDVARRSLELADKLVEDNKARVEVGTLAPIDIVQAEAEAANRRQALAQIEATLQTAQLLLKRLIVSGTGDPLWNQELRAVDLPQLTDPPTDIEGAVRHALERRTDIVAARRNLDSNDVTLRYWRNQTLPSVDLQANYGAQGIGGTQFIRQGSGLGSTVIGTIPGGYTDALSVLGARDYPTWNLFANISYPIGRSSADAQAARTRVQRNQTATRLRSLELQVAAEVTNAALQVQANLRRVDSARAARELAQRRLEAEQSKFEVGMSTNFFVVQAQRDLADAENVELRALADLQKSIVTFERSQEAPANGGSGNSGSGGVTGSTTAGLAGLVQGQ
jgi:outer membrane protein